LYHQFGCANCHHFNDSGRAPNLQNLYNRSVQIEGGETVVADETYLRESIVQPRAKIVWGWQPIMPTFEGQLSEDQIISLIAYIKAIGGAPGSEQPASSGSSPEQYGSQKGIAGPGSSANSATPPENR